MSGIPFRVNGKGEVLVSWMSRNKAYWAKSADGGKHFGEPVGTPDGGRRPEALPVCVANGKGEVLLVWLQGNEVAWAVYRADGAFTGQRGVAGKQALDNKPTAFATADGAFYIVF